ncbi:MAG: hypothetical protein WBP64_19950, partial [Nitrososphaeraceae archaeon]
MSAKTSEKEITLTLGLIVIAISLISLYMIPTPAHALVISSNLKRMGDGTLEMSNIEVSNTKYGNMTTISTAHTKPFITVDTGLILSFSGTMNYGLMGSNQLPIHFVLFPADKMHPMDGAGIIDFEGQGGVGKANAEINGYLRLITVAQGITAYKI